MTDRPQPALPEWAAEAHWTPEAVIAFRGWTWDEVTQLLVGPHGRPWPSARMVATDSRNDHPSPYPGCNCGINAYKDVLKARPYPILGKVALTGTVDEYEQGYRASHGEILEIFVYFKYNSSLDYHEMAKLILTSGPWPDEPMDRILRETYGVPVTRGKRIGWRPQNGPDTEKEIATWQK